MVVLSPDDDMMPLEGGYGLGNMGDVGGECGEVRLEDMLGRERCVVRSVRVGLRKMLEMPGWWRED